MFSASGPGGLCGGSRRGVPTGGLGDQTAVSGPALRVTGVPERPTASSEEPVPAPAATRPATSSAFWPRALAPAAVSRGGRPGCAFLVGDASRLRQVTGPGLLVAGPSLGSVPCGSREEATVESLSLKRREGPRRSRGWVGFSSHPQLLIQFFLWHPEPICRTFCVSSYRLPSVLCKHGPTPVSGGGAGPEPGQARCHCLSRSLVTRRS